MKILAAFRRKEKTIMSRRLRRRSSASKEEKLLRRGTDESDHHGHKYIYMETNVRNVLFLVFAILFFHRGQCSLEID